MESVERVEFKNGRGHRLVGVLHRPAEAPRGGVVVAHGMLSSKDSDKHRRSCEALARLGYLALRFDFSGRGESKTGQDELSFTSDVDDLRSAVGLLREQGAGRLGLVGSSMGGAVSLLTATREPGVGALVTISAPAYLHDRPHPNWTSTWLEQARRIGRLEVQPGLFVSASIFDELARYELLAEAAQVRVPWLILHGRLDELIPVEDAEAFAGANPGARLQVHPEADHRFLRPEWRDWLVGQISGFLPSVL